MKNSKASDYSIDGYRALLHSPPSVMPDTTTEDYATEQSASNSKRTIDFLIPLVQEFGASSLLDVGCGTGTMTATLLEKGYDAYGVDLPGLAKHWSRQGLPRDNYFVVDPLHFELPFDDEMIDFAFTFGVIEHVGTSDGHSDRLDDYHEIRRKWLREVFRSVRVGGHLLVGGPSRNFPVDVAHGPDSRASNLAKWMYRKTGATIHKTWGENFLWGYGDIDSYLGGLSYKSTALSMDGYFAYSRIPRVIRPMVRSYVKALPDRLLATGFNPWVMALIQKTA